MALRVISRFGAALVGARVPRVDDRLEQPERQERDHQPGHGEARPQLVAQRVAQDRA